MNTIVKLFILISVILPVYCNVHLKFVNGFYSFTTVTVDLDFGTFSHTFQQPGFVGYLSFDFGPGYSSHIISILDKNSEMIAISIQIYNDGDNYTVFIFDTTPYIDSFYDNTTFTPANECTIRLFLGTPNLGSNLSLIEKIVQFGVPQVVAHSQTYGSITSRDVISPPIEYEYYYCDSSTCDNGPLPSKINIWSKLNSLINLYVFSKGLWVEYIVDTVT
jgi:hypothetical protein